MNSLNKQINNQSLAFALLVIMLPFLFFDLSSLISPTPRFVSELLNLAHIPLLLLLSYSLWPGLVRYHSTKHRALFSLIIVTIGISVGVEVAQTLIGRFASWVDLRRDLLGLALFIALCPTLFSAPSRFNRVLLPLTLFWLLIECLPFSLFLIDYYHLHTHPHVLSDFESPGQVSRWSSGKLVNTHRDGHSRALRIPLTIDRYSGSKLEHLPRNWSDAKTFYFEVFNADSTPQKLNIKVQDSLSVKEGNDYSMRFNGVQSIQPGWNSINIPIQAIREAPHHRPMQISDIHSIELFVTNRQSPGYLLVDNLRLR